MELKTCLLLLKICLYAAVLVRHCSNATGCSSAEFECSGGECVPESHVCDDEDDCPDSSDETQCESSRCMANEFPCANGNCIPYNYRCDGDPDSDCGDYSDEECDPFLDNFLIVAEVGTRRDLYQILLSNGTMVPLKVSSPKINAVAFDGNTKTVYWTDVDSGTIRRYSLTNKSIEIIYTAPPGGHLEGLALDVDNDSLYYCRLSSSIFGSPGIIGRMSLNGENHRTVVSEPNGNPRSIVLDKVNRLMYWTDWSDNPMILRASMEDGDDRTVLVNSSIKWPNALAIDFEGDILYWGDAWFHRIESISLSGRRNRRIVLDESSTNATYFSFALSSNYLYVTDRGKRSVRKFDLRTSTMVDQSPVGIFDRLNGIVHYNSKSVPEAKNLSRRRPPKTPSTTFKTTIAQSPVGIRRTKTTSVHGRVSVTTTGMLSASRAVTDEGPISLDPAGKPKSSLAGSSITTVVAVIVVGVIVITCVITAGIVVLRAKRARNRLFVDKRVVLPPTQRDIDSYHYSPVFAHSEGRGGIGGGGEGGTGSAATGGRYSSPSGSDDAETPSSSASGFAPRGPVVRTSSSKPILDEDILGLNNFYSTIAGDYENMNPYEIIDD